MKIIPLSEGTFTVDKTKVFVPFDKQTDEMQARTAGSLLVEIQPFAIITSKDILLIDTGLGFKDANGKMQLHNNLASAGINPSDITKVLMSHLHKDHAGGVSVKEQHDKLSFPDATYYVQRREIDYAFEKGFPSFITEDIEVLKTAPNVHFLEDDNGYIDEYIEYKVTGAHSPLHQVFWIRDENETVFFGGDDAPQLQQMKHRFAAKYDYDGKKAMELRNEWWEQGEKEKWNFLFYHDVKNPTWKFD